MMAHARFQISKVEMKKNSWRFIIYDLGSECVVDEITDYAFVMVMDRGNSPITVEQALLHLVEFWRYLEEKKVKLHSICDLNLKEFRDKNLEKVVKSSAHRGDLNDAMNTVNIKLSRIYDWLIWLQDDGRLPVGTVGLRGLIHAAKRTEAEGLPRGRRRYSTHFSNYPLLYKISGRNSKHKAPGSEVFDEHVHGINDLFLSRYAPFIAQRNILFVDIAESAGFRRGSICSLKVNQFSREAIDSSTGEFLVQPSSQKFSRRNTFGIPISLAYRVLEFINNYWMPRVEEKKILAKVHQNRIFISATTGKPLEYRSMSQEIAAAFREFGLPKGTGPHKLRGKFSSEESDRELAERMELGLDTSSASIAATMALKMGQKDPNQFYGYAASSQSRRARIAREGARAENKALREENQRLKELLEKKGRQ